MAKPETLTNPVDFGDNPYLIGPHEPIRQELDRPKLQCIGEIPKDFSGIFFVCDMLNVTHKHTKQCVISQNNATTLYETHVQIHKTHEKHARNLTHEFTTSCAISQTTHEKHVTIHKHNTNHA